MKNTATQHLTIDTHRCTGYWKCVKHCPEQVLGKVKFLGLVKHAAFEHPERCVLCCKCVMSCKHHAITKISQS